MSEQKALREPNWAERAGKAEARLQHAIDLIDEGRDGDAVDFLVSLDIATPEKALRGWQPWSTAPKDGTKILAYRDGDVETCCYSRSDMRWGLPARGWYYPPWNEPTHWQPILAPPAQHAAEEER